MTKNGYACLSQCYGTEAHRHRERMTICIRRKRPSKSVLVDVGYSQASPGNVHLVDISTSAWHHSAFSCSKKQQDDVTAPLVTQMPTTRTFSLLPVLVAVWFLRALLVLANCPERAYFGWLLMCKHSLPSTPAPS